MKLNHGHGQRLSNSHELRGICKKHIIFFAFAIVFNQYLLGTVTYTYAYMALGNIHPLSHDLHVLSFMHMHARAAAYLQY